MNMYMPNMELHVIFHCLPLLLVLLAVEAFESNTSETDSNRAPRSSRRVVRLYSGTRPEPIVCRGEGFQADPVNCAVFYRCMKSGRGRFMSFQFQCAPGTIFDPDTEGCNHPSAVKRSNCGIDHSITVSEQLQDNAIEDMKQELPSPITTKLPLYTKISSSPTTHPWLTSSKRQDFSTSHPRLTSTYDHNIINSISTKPPIHKTSNEVLTGQFLTYTRKERSTTPRVSSISQKPGAQNGDYCRSEGFMGDSENCRKFYRCISNFHGGYIRYEFMCTESTIWDEDIQSCNHAWAVKKRRCGRGNINEISNEVNINQDIPNDDTTRKITPNIIQQNFLGEQTQESSSYVTQSPSTNLIISTNVITTKKETTPNYLNNVKQNQQYVVSTEKLTSFQNEENDVGYTYKNTERKVNPSSTDCTESGFMGDKNDCKKFYRCVDNGKGSYTKFEFSCGEGTVWDANIEACNHAWAVKECGGKGSTQDIGTSSTATSTATIMTSTKSTPVYISTLQTTVNDNDDNIYGNQNPTSANTPSSISTTKVTKQPRSNCTSTGFIGDENDCRIFYRCVDNGEGSFIQYQFTCGEGTVWDPNLGACNHIWAVSECGGKGSTKNPVQSEDTTILSPNLTTSALTKSTPYYISTTQTTKDEDNDTGYGNENQDTIATKTEPPSFSSTTTFNKQPENNCSSSGYMGDENDCRKFYRCVDKGNGEYTRYEFLCGEGTVWDPKVEACNHPWAVEKCGGNPSLTTEKMESSTTIIETHTIQSTELPQNDDSDSGYGIQQDESSSPQEDTLSSSSTTTTSNQPQHSSNNCSSNGFIGDQFDCKKFYRCVEDGSGGFKRYEFTCGEGTVWDPKIDACNHPWAVEKCGGSLNNDIDKEDVSATSQTTIYSSSTTTSYENEIVTHMGQSSSQSTIVSSSEPSSQGNECKVSGFMGDGKNCKKFYRCVDNGDGSFTRYEFICGEGTIWDQELQTCNHESDRKCFNISTENTNELLTTTNTITTMRTTSSYTESNEIHSSSLDSVNDTCISEGFYANSMDCKKFYRCVPNDKGGYTKYEFSCGDGTMWVQDIQACDHHDSNSNCSSFTSKPQQTEDQQSTTPQHSPSVTSASTGFSTERPNDEYHDSSSNAPIQESDYCSSEGFYPNRKDCKKFYRCVDNGQGSYTKYDFSCGEGTAWDIDIQTCNHISDVKRCHENGQGDSQNKPMQDEGVSQNTESNDLTTHKMTTESSESNGALSTDSCESEGYFGNKQDCTKFFRCVDNGNGGYTKYEFVCGEGTIWDQDITTCNHPQDVVNPSCNQQSGSSLSSTTSTQSNNIESTSEQATNCSQENTTKKPLNQNVTCEKAGYYANPNDCKKFYRCVDWDGNGEKFSVYHFECGEGTIWDPQLDTCNHEESVYPPRDCSGTQSQNENNIQESSTNGSSTSQQTTTELDSTTTEQSTTTEKSTTDETITQITTTSEHTTTQETITQHSTTTEELNTEKPTQQSTTAESATTEKETTTDRTTTQQSFTTESTTTQQSTMTEKTSTLMTTEVTTVPQTTTTEETQQTMTTEETTQSTTTESTTTQQSTTTEGTTESIATTQQSTTDENTTQQTTTSQTSTIDSSGTTESGTITEELIDNQLSTTESISTTVQKEDESTSESTDTEGTPSDNKCPDTDEDQYLYVCPTSFRRHPKYCNMFYQCTEDDENHQPKIAVFTCPNNTIYEESKTQCVEESKAAKKCDGQIAQSRKVKRLNTHYEEPIVVGKEKYSCSSTGYYPFEKTSECSPAFLKCQKAKSGRLRGYVHQCPEGYLYWSISKRCERKDNLKDCRTSSNDWSRRWEIPIERKNVAM